MGAFQAWTLWMHGAECIQAWQKLWIPQHLEDAAPVPSRLEEEQLSIDQQEVLWRVQKIQKQRSHVARIKGSDVLAPLHRLGWNSKHTLSLNSWTAERSSRKVLEGTLAMETHQLAYQWVHSRLIKWHKYLHNMRVKPCSTRNSIASLIKDEYLCTCDGKHLRKYYLLLKHLFRLWVNTCRGIKTPFYNAQWGVLPFECIAQHHVTTIEACSLENQADYFFANLEFQRFSVSLYDELSSISSSVHSYPDALYWYQPPEY